MSRIGDGHHKTQKRAVWSFNQLSLIEIFQFKNTDVQKHIGIYEKKNHVKIKFVRKIKRTIDRRAVINKKKKARERRWCLRGQWELKNSAQGSRVAHSDEPLTANVQRMI